MSVSDGWVSVTEAAASAAVSERTVWRWIHAGIVESRAEKRGQRETRLVNQDSLPPTDADRQEPEPLQARATDSDSQPSGAVSPNQSVPDIGVECQGFTDVRHEAAPVECACCKVWERQVGTLEEQLESRTEELRRRDQAEEQLRVMLVRLEQTNAQLAGALIQKALPPAVEVKEMPRRVRWWWPFGRRS
jgi:hypothetical protein